MGYSTHMFSYSGMQVKNGSTACLLHKGNMERSHVTEYSTSGVKAIVAHKGVQVTQ